MEFEREELLLGEKIDILKNKTILVLGLGGVGGYVTESLARCGIGNLILVDWKRKRYNSMLLFFEPTAITILYPLIMSVYHWHM